MKKSAKIIISILCAFIVAGILFIIVWQFDVFGIFTEYKIVPVINLKGDKVMSLECGTEYKEPGYTAEIDGEDATDKVEVDNSQFDNTKTGSYKILYSLANNKGTNKITVERTINVADHTKPSLTIKGDETVRVLLGTEYKDAGATAADIADGDLTKKIVSDTSTVNVNVKGKYTVTYSVTDAAGNTAKAERTVVVFQRSPGYTVYLTFDDGPSENTLKILDLLKKYNAHATFFVVGTNAEAHRDIIKKIYESGNVVAVHTYTHDYEKIYKSEKAFWDDNEKTRSLVKEITGESPKYMRFPGGASNTISSAYCSGIMTALTNSASSHKYEYFDWNISSGDAAGNLVDTKTLYTNIMAGIHENYENPIVLMHDSEAKTTTVEAVAKVLKDATAEGYVFEAIDDTVKPVHHGVNN